MNLDQIQRAMFHAVRQPLTPSDDMRRTALDGTSLLETAETIIKPNTRLTSFERLEIYNRQYWFRVISSMADDFDGLRAVLGEKQFQKLVVAYLNDCPSTSFTLRNLGSKLEEWLTGHRDYAADRFGIALDMVKLGWAEVETFDSEGCRPVTADDIAQMGDDPFLRLQPYIRLLELTHPVHDLLLKLRQRRRDDEAPMRKLPARSLPGSQQTFVAVHRQENSVYFKDLDATAFAMLRLFQSGSTVSHAIESTNWEERGIDEISAAVREYFANWAGLGWFCKADYPDRPIR
ncbi:MAG TPA: putative DNA-binding domain-containing protein [Terriglobales bacterium]|nr:putative DNA-binding domain-containing protein [Terriglobales bacterium]